MNRWVQGPRRQRYLGALQISTASPNLNTPSEKRQLRQTLRARRRLLPRWSQRRAAQRLARIAARQHWFRRAHSLALYFANDDEMDPAPLMKLARAAGKRIFLPRLRDKQLEFVAHGIGGKLRRNGFDIPEPVGAAISLRKLDVVCVPLVAFDHGGRRLGMGGGFYDRTFARKRNAQRPLLIGLAYAFQEVAQLPCERWDVPLAGVVTERKWRRARQVLKT